MGDAISAGSVATVRMSPDISRVLTGRRTTVSEGVPSAGGFSAHDERTGLIARPQVNVERSGDDAAGKPRFRSFLQRRGDYAHESQKIELEDGLYATVYGYRLSRPKTALYGILCVGTGGILYLLCRWFIGLRLWLTASRTSLAEATMVLIRNSWGHLELCAVRREYHGDEVAVIYKSIVGADTGNTLPGTAESSATASPPVVTADSGQLRRISYRCTEFVFVPRQNAFFPLAEWSDTRSVDTMSLGLDRHAYFERKTIFGVNSILIPAKTNAELLVDEVLHPFYMFQVFSITLWCFESYYYYAACIFIISTVSSALSLLETRGNLLRLRAMARYQCNLRVLRSGVWLFASSEDLVPGDVYEVTNDMASFPADSLLLSGDCIVNESMLTGESIPVFKLPADLKADTPFTNDIEKIDPRYVLFCGTQIIRARASASPDSPGRDRIVMAMVVRTGFNTMKGSLIRSIMYPKPSSFQFYKDSFKFVGVLASIAVVGFFLSFISFLRRGVSWFFIIIRASDLITIVVPPALPAAMSVGTNFSIGRLKKKSIFCISPPRVNVCGKLNIMVFDKTGTLTEDGLDVLGVQQVSSSGDGCDYLQSDIRLFQASTAQFGGTHFSLLHGLATCHSLKRLHSGLVGDPLDLKMFQFTGWTLEESDEHGVVPVIVRPPGSAGFDLSQILILKPAGELPTQTAGSAVPSGDESRVELGVIRCFEFSSNLRRMSVIVKQLASGHISAYCKGAPEVIRHICNAQTIPADFDKLLNAYTRDGYRVLAFAGKSLEGFSWMRSQKIERADVESELQFLGFIVFENKLKRETVGALGMLSRANIRGVMCTGDNLLTAVSVGKSCHLIDDSATVYVPYLRLNETGQNRVVWESMDDATMRLDPLTLAPLKPPQTTITSQSPSSSRSGSLDDLGVRAFGDHRLSSNVTKRAAILQSGGNEPPRPHTSRYSAMTNFSLAVTGDVFDFVVDNYPSDTLNRLLVKADVFARMSPEQKHVLVEKLQAIGYCAGMCGDGANDCGALKAADVGISLSEAEASVAAPFTSRISNIDCVLDIIREGRAALVTSFSCFQYIAMYSMIQFCSVSLLYTQMSTLGDLQFLFIDLVMILPIALFMGRTEASDKLHSKRPTAKLVSRKVLLPLFGQIVVQCVFQAFLYFDVRRYPWYMPSTPDPSKANIASFENTTLFLVSSFQYIAVAVAYSVGPPYRKGIASNRLLVSTLAIITAICLYCLLGPGEFVANLFELMDLPQQYRFWLLAMIVANTALSLILEHYVFPKLNDYLGEKMYIKHEHELVRRDRSACMHAIKRLLGLPRLKTTRKQFKTILEDYHRTSGL